MIVPAGSKGGFVLLTGPAEPEQLAEEGKEQYRTLIRGLLDVTWTPPARSCRPSA